MRGGVGAEKKVKTRPARGGGGGGGGITHRVHKYASSSVVLVIHPQWTLCRVTICVCFFLEYLKVGMCDIRAAPWATKAAHNTVLVVALASGASCYLKRTGWGWVCCETVRRACSSENFTQLLIYSKSLWDMFTIISCRGLLQALVEIFIRQSPGRIRNNQQIYTEYDCLWNHRSITVT